MNKNLTVEVVVEGPTENLFVKNVLAPYWALRGIFVTPPKIRTRIDKHTGTVYAGGDIRFPRVAKQVGNFLKQRRNIVVASFVDYYGLKEWPSLDTINEQHSPRDIARILNQAAMDYIQQSYPETLPQKRYFPFTAVHEFEALLFSDTFVLSKHLHIPVCTIDAVLQECGSPEEINNSPETAPSKRLDQWTTGQYGKTTTGISIAQEIGIDAMRQRCPLFDDWLTAIERLQEEL